MPRSRVKYRRMSRIVPASQATQMRAPSGMAAALAASASSTPKASLERRWCQVIVVLGGPESSISSSGPSTSMCTSTVTVSGRASSRVPAAGTRHRELVTGLGPLGPLRRGTLAVQQELDLQGLGRRVVAARGVGADRGRRSVIGLGGTRCGELREVRRLLALGGEEHLEVRGRGGVREPAEFIAGNDDGYQARGDLG